MNYFDEELLQKIKDRLELIKKQESRQSERHFEFNTSSYGECTTKLTVPESELSLSQIQLLAANQIDYLERKYPESVLQLIKKSL